LKAIMAWLATADQRVTAQSGLTRYIEEIRRVPMLEPHEEYMLAKRWREHGDLEALHKLVNSHLRLVAGIAKSYRGYGLPISELISEGNVGLMQAVKRFEPEKGFRLATYAMWWIKAAIQEYILRSWSLVKMGTTVNQKSFCARRGRLTPGPGQAHRQTPRRHQAGCGRHEPAPWGRCIA
jgi:RNA polymerase sigma-32 factor